MDRRLKPTPILSKIYKTCPKDIKLGTNVVEHVLLCTTYSKARVKVGKISSILHIINVKKFLEVICELKSFIYFF